MVLLQVEFIVVQQLFLVELFLLQVLNLMVKQLLNLPLLWLIIMLIFLVDMFMKLILRLKHLVETIMLKLIHFSEINILVKIYLLTLHSRMLDYRVTSQ